MSSRKAGVGLNPDAVRSRTTPALRMRYRLSTRAVARAAKLDRGACIDCGMVVTEDNLVCFDWDHRDPQQKIWQVGEMVRRGSPGDVEAEIAKCDLRCANCHRLRTFRLGHNLTRHRERLRDDDQETLF